MNNPDPEDPYDDLSLYAYSRNNPIAYFDPDGRIPILIPIVAGLLGGGLNLATNWSKIKDPIQGLGYFASGAAGGVISLTNPLAGGAITSAGNATIDIATGNVPDFNNPTDALLYVGKEAAVGAATSFAGAQAGKIIGPALAKLGNTIGGWFKNSFQAYAKESINTIIINGKPITTTIDVGIKATKQYVARALGNSVGNTIKGEFNATSFADEIIAINKTTEGGGRLLSTTPLSVINSAIYYETAAEQGSSIFRSIIKNHMFYDGNKRTAVAAFQSFAKQHGLTTVSQQQMMNVANQVATGHVTEILQISKLLLK